MANEIERMAEAVEGVEKGFGDLREFRAGLEVWRDNTDKRLDYLHDKTIAEIKTRLKDLEDNRVKKVEDFQMKMGAILAVAVLVMPFLAPYIMKLIAGE